MDQTIELTKSQIKFMENERMVHCHIFYVGGARYRLEIYKDGKYLFWLADENGKGNDILKGGYIPSEEDDEFKKDPIGYMERQARKQETRKMVRSVISLTVTLVLLAAMMIYIPM